MKPRYLAALQYAVLGAFLIASWWLLLSPLDRATEQLEVIFAPDYENRNFFIFYALSAVASSSLAIAFMLKKSNSKTFSVWLAVIATILFAIAIWFFDSLFIFSFGFGCVCSLWHISSLTTHSSGTPRSPLV